MRVLVTGAAGYIGSIIVNLLMKEGIDIIALDSLKHGHREAIGPRVTFYNVDIGAQGELEQIFRLHKIDTVIHLAAETIVKDSIVEPVRYFQNNVEYGINLLNTMLAYGVRNIIFSSSAAVYGMPDNIPTKETDLVSPINPYGESKLIFEKILKRYGDDYGLKSISLRYFNVAGAVERFGEDHRPETHLIPNILKVAMKETQSISIFGNDYLTKDGSCVRDYVHVSDVANANLISLKNIEQIDDSYVFNIGIGRGYSNIETVKIASKVTGVNIPIVIHPKRSGDAPELISCSEPVKLILGWKPQYETLEEIIESAWIWYREHPKGYG